MDPPPSRYDQNSSSTAIGGGDCQKQHDESSSVQPYQHHDGSLIDSMAQRFHSIPPYHGHHHKQPLENKVLPLSCSPPQPQQQQPQKFQLQRHLPPLLSPTTKGILKHPTTATTTATSQWKTVTVLDEFPKLEYLNVNEKQIKADPAKVQGEGDTERTTDDDDDDDDKHVNNNHAPKDRTTTTILNWDEIDGCQEELEPLDRSASLTFFLKRLLPEHGCVEEPSLVMDNAVPPAPHLLPSRCMNARQESMHFSSLFLSSSSNDSSGQAMLLFSDSSFADAGGMHASHSTLLTNDSIVSSDLPQALSSSLPSSSSTSFPEDVQTTSSPLARSSAVEYLMDEEDNDDNVDNNDDNVQFHFSIGRNRKKKSNSKSNRSINKKMGTSSALSSPRSIPTSQVRLQQQQPPQPHPQQQQQFSGENAFMGDDAPPTKPCRQVSTDMIHLTDDSCTDSCREHHHDDEQTHQQQTCFDLRDDADAE